MTRQVVRRGLEIAVERERERCAEVARRKVLTETSDEYLANRVWHAVSAGPLAPPRPPAPEVQP